VAAVADELLERSPRRLDRFAKLWGGEPAAVRKALVLLIALHDIGKFSCHFQAKSPHGPRGEALGIAPPRVRHDAIGYELLRLKSLGLDKVLAHHISGGFDHDLFVAVTGHHGAPALSAGGSWLDGFGKAEKQYVMDFTRDVARLLPSNQPLPPLGKRARLMSWDLAGLTNLCDWIGSNRCWFEFTRPNLDLAAYWQQARKKARVAVSEAGILRVPPAEKTLTSRLLPHLANVTLSPLQQQALGCDLGQGPVLVLIEDVTGAGKTEAAVIIAARLIAKKRADGLFFALPTMATANAMYERLGATYRRLFDDGSEPSLVLAHGKRSLHDGFRTSILTPSQAPDEASARQKPETQADETASAACAAWIADDRRKSFLAHVGIGTIDQSLLAVLPTRFQSLRLWGLADRVLVIDEAHSFDSYVSRELETLLEFHAALGGSAVVLSATLSTKARQQLANAFVRGLGREPAAITAAEYPLSTIVDGATARSTPVGARADISRTLTVSRIGSMEQAANYVADLSIRGAAVAWIRNAVDDAIAAKEMLEERGLSPILLHARFAMGDRLAIEEVVQQRLGKSSTPQTRRDAQGRGMVLVGTQILEQSLDYDVDGMVSDLAPVDMIIQRAGRLWRHPHRTPDRPIGVAERALMLLSPDPNEAVSRDWYRNLSPRAAAVYDDHGLVWLSARALIRTGQITTPGGVRDLLAAVYDEANHADIPEGLERTAREADGKRRAARSLAASNSLDIALGYAGNHRLWEADTITPTRLGQPVTVFRLAKRNQAGRIVPWSDADTPRRAWALSECSVLKARASGVPQQPSTVAREVEQAKADWSEWELDQPLLLLEPDGAAWCGVVIDKDNCEVGVLYDKHLGWRFASAGNSPRARG
jgi:CRISPR-associated endonuclease/helicase Cas3